jgi:tetratricopeptide (TPR) repeat protein
MAYWQSVARIGVQVANALNYAHRQGTLHRDIKPANLLIDEGGTIWVADFGLAKAMEQDNVSRTGDIVGTLRYMAPEQFLGTADVRSDIYSLGLTLYELLTLKPAFDETQRKRSFLHDAGSLEPARPRRTNPSIPRDLETIILKAIAAEPDARYQTSAELSEDLQRFLEDRPIQARRANVAERLLRWRRRNPAVATLSGLAISLLLLVAIVSTVAYVRTKHAKELAENAETSEREQRVKAEATSELAWDALDKIFERLAPHRYVSPEDFAIETEESAEFNVNTQPVLSNEAAALLDEMLVFYRKLAEQGDDTDEFRQRIAEANRRVGDIRQRLGQFDQAEQAYRQAIAMYSQLEDGGKTDPKQAAALASIYNQLGEVLRNSFQFDQARTAFDNARAILEPIATKTSPPEVRYELARSFYLRVHRFDGPGPSQGMGFGSSKGKRGNSRRDGDSGRDSDNIERAIALLEELTSQYQVPDYQQLLALCYAECPRTLRFEDRDKSDQAITKAVSLLEDLVARYPQNPDYRFTLSTVYSSGLRKFGPPPSEDELAITEKRALTALKLLDDLHRDHPGVPDYVQSQLNVHRGLAMLFSRAGRFDDAQSHFQEAIQLFESLNKSEASGSGRVVDIGGMMGAMFTRQWYADMLLGRFRKVKEADGDARPEWLLQAREQIQACIDTMKPFADSDPRHRGFLGEPYKRLVAVNSELGDEAAAAAATDNMKKYQWNDAERREERRPPGGDRGPGERGPGNRPRPPEPERPARDAEPRS